MRQWPVVRTYTVRRWVPEAPEMWIDFVVHGDAGIAGPWAANGPGRVTRCGSWDRAAATRRTRRPAWHLLAGDESALPAIAAALEGMPAGAKVQGLHRGGRARPRSRSWRPSPTPRSPGCTAAPGRSVRRWSRPSAAWSSPPGEVHAFVHGEATFVKDLRGHLRLDRGLPMYQLSISGYWRRGMNEDGWQSSKREWNQQVDKEQEAAPAAG